MIGVWGGIEKHWFVCVFVCVSATYHYIADGLKDS